MASDKLAQGYQPLTYTERYKRLFKNKTFKDRRIKNLSLFVCELVADCDTWLGMAHEKEPSIIPNSALTASSSYNNNKQFNALQARLFKQTYHSPKGKGAWRPFSSDQNQYLQVDLGRVTQVSGFIIMGKQYDGHYVSEYWVAYSNDGAQWSDVTESGSAKVGMFCFLSISLSFSFFSFFFVSFPFSNIALTKIPHDHVPKSHVNTCHFFFIATCNATAFQVLSYKRNRLL